MAQADTRRPLTADVWVRFFPALFQGGIFGRESGTGTRFPQSTSVSLVSIISTCGQSSSLSTGFV